MEMVSDFAKRMRTAGKGGIDHVGLYGSLRKDKNYHTRRIRDESGCSEVWIEKLEKQEEKFATSSRKPTLRSHRLPG